MRDFNNLAICLLAAFVLTPSDLLMLQITLKESLSF